MDKNTIFSLIKTECGRAKYEMLASKNGIFNRIRLYWFIVFAAIEDWNVIAKDQSKDLES
tara:strand:- start:188 stop:367 length:180 start_codon:yes stop_codon:yes gene_type:complete